MMEIEQRSEEQNKYYWGIVVNFIAFYKKWNPNTAHDWIKVSWDIGSTASLNKYEFERLMNAIRVHTNRFWNMIIPLPNEDLEKHHRAARDPYQIYLYYNPTQTCR